MRPTALFSLCLLAAAPLAAQQPAPSPAPSASPAAAGGDAITFPAQIEQVNVDVVVTDKNNQPIRDLRREEFTLRGAGRISFGHSYSEDPAETVEFDTAA